MSDEAKDLEVLNAKLHERRRAEGVGEGAARSGLLLSPLFGARMDAAEVARVLAQREEDAKRRAAEEDAQRLRSRAEALRLPSDERIRSVVLNGRPEGTAAMRAILSAAAWRARRSIGQVTILAGPPGTGKSCAAAWMLLRRGSGSVWLSAQEIATTPETSYSTNRDTWRAWLSAQTLVVDDLGTESGEPDAASSLLARRFDSGRWTIVTTNLDQAAFAARYLAGASGSRLSDRMRGQREEGCSSWCDTGQRSLRGVR